MARLFGLIGNRADLSARVLELEREKLLAPESVVPGNGPVSWGLGFYQAGEVLLRRRPSDERRAVDLAAIGREARADLMIGHVRAATVGGLRAENTHPFRYREWLFAHTGSIERYEQLRPRLLESIPEFLRKNLRGDTDSEVIFHLVLSFLHDAGRLNVADADARAVTAALTSTLSLIDHLVEEEGGEPGFPINAILANGELLGAVHRAGADARSSMALRTISGRSGLDALVADDPLRKVRLTDPGALRFTLVASDFDPSQIADITTTLGAGDSEAAHAQSTWAFVPPRSVIVTSRDANPRIELL